MKKLLVATAISAILWACTKKVDEAPAGNPLFVELNEPVRFDLITPEYIQEAYDSARAGIAPSLDAIVQVPEQEKTFSNTMLKLDDLYDRLSTPYSIIYLLASVHPDSATRETAKKISTDFAQLYNELQLNEDLYKAVKTYSETADAGTLAGYKKKFLSETLTEFERNGFALSLEEREQLKEILNEISAIGSEFSSNIASYQDYTLFTEEEMEGTTEAYKKNHLQPDGMYKVGLSYPDYLPFMKNAVSSEARKKLNIKYYNRASDKNLDVLTRLLKKRKEMANLLGYPTFADYQTETRMVKSPGNAWEFEEKLAASVKPKGQSDYQELVAFQSDLGINKQTVDPWDKEYLIEELKSQKYGVDEEEVRQYFPLGKVKEGLFTITQKLFGLTYEPIENPYVWHPDVEAYNVMENGTIIGRFYLDLHPRPNKYTHAACFGMISSKQLENDYQIPQATLVCNFTEPTKEKPALMTHSEVETFFHEFGHVLHQLLSKTSLGAQAGTSVARDFVEAPSQIFENWVWNYESLRLFARHYETDEVLPKELFDKMLAAKNVMSGLNTLRQIFYGSYDLTLYNRFDPEGAISTTEVRQQMEKEICLFDAIPDTHFEAAFGHLYGYGASYYGYLWSEVYAQDMFSKFEEEGILNPEIGKAYREKILSRGSEKEEMEMLVDFLGRTPDDQAFVKSIGL